MHGQIGQSLIVRAQVFHQPQVRLQLGFLNFQNPHDRLLCIRQDPAALCSLVVCGLGWAQWGEEREAKSDRNAWGEQAAGVCHGYLWVHWGTFM